MKDGGLCPLFLHISITVILEGSQTPIGSKKKTDLIRLFFIPKASPGERPRTSKGEARPKTS